MDRRAFLRNTAVSAGVLALGPSFWRSAYAAPAQPGPGYGPLAGPDANGILLPAGFSSRVIASSGQPVGTSSVWHPYPDGGATFSLPDGGWIYVSNSEVPGIGGVGAVRFDAAGTLTGAHRVLVGTSLNCAGGRTPWGTWLTCEEHDFGHVWECSPTGLNDNATALRRALGTFAHEAAAVDPVRRHVYLTEDKPDGRFYRFTPANPAAWPDLSAGTLEAAVATPITPVDPADPRWTVTWLPIPNPNPTPAETATRLQVPATTAFNGGEGCWYDTDTVYFTTKGDNRVWALNAATSVLELVYDDDLATSPVLTGVDNVIVNGAREIFVAEDGGDMQVVVIAPDRTYAPLLQVTGQDGSEITGLAFDPSGTRLYFSSQRGPGAGTGAGITYEVRGPFRGGPVGVPAADGGLLSGLVHTVVEPPVRSVVPPVGDVVHAVDRGLAGLGL
jgi:secreted PhoX family phosphatase